LTGFAGPANRRARDPELAERLVFITGDTLSPTTHLRLEQSGNLYLPKPFSIGQLEATLQQLLRRRSIGSSNR
jgi:two-component system NtrC family sensor kinase